MGVICSECWREIGCSWSGSIFIPACRCWLSVVFVLPVMIRNALFCVRCSVVMCDCARVGIPCHAGVVYCSPNELFVICCEGFLGLNICCGSKCAECIEFVLGFCVSVIYMFFEGAKDYRYLVEWDGYCLE